MKIIYKYGLVLFSLGLAVLLNAPVFAESEDGTSGLVEKISKINQEIHRISKSQSTYYKKAIKYDGAPVDEVNDLNNQFRDVLAQYKPNTISWASFDPVDYYQIDQNDSQALRVFIDDINDAKIDLKDILSQMKELVREIRQGTTVRTNSGPRVINSPSYRYIYPRQYYRSYPYGYDDGYYYYYPSYGYRGGFFNMFL